MSGRCPHIVTSCKVIQQLEGSWLWGRAGACKYSSLTGLIISRHVPALAVTPVCLIQLQTGGRWCLGTYAGGGGSWGGTS